jgi:hypothetical protein
MKREKDIFYLYAARGDKESEEAWRVLSASRIRFKKISINRNGYGKSMFRDLHTTEVPSLATRNSVLIGLKNIKSFVREIECGSSFRLESQGHRVKRDKKMKRV